MPEERCWRCSGKVGYGTEAEAMDALVVAKIKRSLKGNQRRRETRAYLCPHRPGIWHLSSKEEADYIERQAQMQAREERRKAVAPFRSALHLALAGTEHTAHVAALADLLHDAGWTPPRRAQRAA